jgi:hypothetical protein
MAAVRTWLPMIDPGALDARGEAPGLPTIDATAFDGQR